VKGKIVLREVINPVDGSKVWQCQFAVNGAPCMPFYDHEINRRKFASDDEWFERHLYPTAQELLKQYGPAPALS